MTGPFLAVDAAPDRIRAARVDGTAVTLADEAPPAAGADWIAAAQRVANGAVRPGSAGICLAGDLAMTVGLLALSGRYSLEAGKEAVSAAGARLAYAHLLVPGVAPAQPFPAVDVLLVVGGLDFPDHRIMRAALACVDAAAHPAGRVVYAGSAAAREEVAALFPKATTVSNILGEDLRPSTSSCAGALASLLPWSAEGRHGGAPVPVPLFPRAEALQAAMADRLPPAAGFLVVDIRPASVVATARLSGQTSPAVSVVRFGNGSDHDDERATAWKRIARSPFAYPLVSTTHGDAAEAMFHRLRSGDAHDFPDELLVLGSALGAVQNVLNTRPVAAPIESILVTGRCAGRLDTGRWSGLLRRTLGARLSPGADLREDNRDETCFLGIAALSRAGRRQNNPMTAELEGDPPR